MASELAISEKGGAAARFRPYNTRRRSEAAFGDWALDRAWTVTSRGWPDFLCLTPKNRIVCVEAKHLSVHRMTEEQGDMMTVLGAMGIPCYTWHVQGGFTHISGPKCDEIAETD